MMPVRFRQLLLARGMTLIEAPDTEYDTMACNVLAVAPGQVYHAGGAISSPRRGWRRPGCTVWTLPGADLCIKGGGGPTCLTRPLLRA
jgi:N-dimethylarginine dimethylaminohydrolase